MAVTFVQKKTATSGTGSSLSAVAYTSNVVANNQLLVQVTWGTAAGTATVSSVTDSQGNTFTAIPSTLQVTAGTHYANLYTQIYRAVAGSSAADAVTVTMATSCAFINAGLYEVTAGVVDLGSGATGNSATPSAGALTPSADGAFVLAACNLDDGFGFSSGWFTAGSGWTLGNENGGGNQDGADEYRAQATAASVTGAFGSNFGSVAGPWTASIASVVPSGSAPLTPTPGAGSEVLTGRASTIAWTIGMPDQA